MSSMIIKWLFKYLSSKAAKMIILGLVEMYVKRTENTLDDEVFKMIKEILDGGDIEDEQG